MLTNQSDGQRAKCTGYVAQLGFLGGTDDQAYGEFSEHRVLRGVVLSPIEEYSPGDKVIARLFVNGFEISSTATKLQLGDGSDRSLKGKFSFRCDDIWQYLGQGDEITVGVLDGFVKWPSGRDRLIIETGCQSSQILRLVKMLDAGWVFDKLGRIREPRDRGAIERAFSLYREVEAIMEREFGYDIFPMYGSLLGAVREKGFIAHDSKGFDVVYISRHSGPDEVKMEFLEICESLIGKNYWLNFSGEGAYIRGVSSEKWFVDLNYGWFDEDDRLCLGFGWYNKQARGREEFLRYSWGEMSGHAVKIPGNFHDVLFQIYGADWDVPDQGYQHDNSTRVIPSEYSFSDAELVVLYKKELKKYYRQWKTAYRRLSRRVETKRRT